MGPDHQHPLGVTKHTELLIQRYRAAGGGRLELPQNRRCKQYEMEEESCWENSEKHRPADVG